MRITVTAAYRGANLFAPMSVLRQTVDMGDLAGRLAGDLGPAFADGMRACLPEVELEGASLPVILGRAAVALQNRAGAGVAYSAAHQASDPGTWHVVYGYGNPRVGHRAGTLALDLLRHLLAAELEPEHRVAADFDFDATRDLFVTWARRRTVGVYTGLLVKAAEARGIPWFARDRAATMIQLGQGRYQKRFADYLTSDTSYVAYYLATEKSLTHRILRRLALPVAPQRLVGSEADAVRAAEELGYPVVVKPNGLGKSLAVTAGIADVGGVRAAFAKASAHDPAVVVERFIPGREFRMLVIGGKLVGAYERVPPQVVGDGASTIADLVDRVNRDEGRGSEFSLAHYRRLELDDEADRLLAQAGHSRTSVPAKGETVRLRTIPVMDTGGTGRQVTDQVHPDNRAMAVRAAKAIGLDIAGIDFITPDISRSYREVGGGICEVNRTPGIQGHLVSAGGDPPDVMGAVLDSLYPPGTRSRVPVAAVTGGTETATAARLLADVLGAAGRTVGLAAGHAVTTSGTSIGRDDIAGAGAAEVLLRHPLVDTAVLEVKPAPLLYQGAGFDICDVAVVLDASEAEAEAEAVGPPGALVQLLAVVARAARGAVVVNADDARCRGLAAGVDTDRLCYFGADAGHPVVAGHVATGGRAVVLENGDGGPVIVVRRGDERTMLMDAGAVPAAAGGGAALALRNVLAAAAAAYCLGAGAEVIGAAIPAFTAAEDRR